MGRTSIKNKLILCFLALILIVMIVVTAVNLVTKEFYLAQGISTAIALAVGTIFGSLFSKSIVWRLNNLSRVAEKISDGDLTREIQIISQDEVRSLEEIFSMMVNHIRSMIFDIKSISLQVQKANATLVHLTNKMLENSREIDQFARDIAKGSEAQTLIVQKTSLKVESSVKAMNNLVLQSSHTVSKINQAMQKTRQGESNARETLNHLEEVLRQMALYSKPIYKLSSKIERIKLIINVMEGIAQKTDLLSLNASIEATRAGDYGKGFALVADEIRSMADSSKQSSHEITKLVEDILEDNKAVNEFLVKNKADINKGHEIIHGIVETFGEMQTGVQEIFTEVKQMEEVIAKQVDQMRDLSEYFQELSRLADQNFVATQKTTLATDNMKKEVGKIVNAMQALNGLSKKMVETQQRFRLPERLE